jgi:hypothetical protein
VTHAAFFTAGNSLALAAWLVLGSSLFVPRMRRRAWQVTGLVVPVLLALAYAWLLPQGLREAPTGGFGSIGEVRALFASDAALTAGWFHYLAFDLFVGTWIARDGSERRVPALLLLPCLLLTFLAGPAGLLLFLLLRPVVGRIRGESVAS